MTVRDEWRWTDERGVQRLVGTDELRAALASGRLPAATLVWRDGMSEWSPAASRPELENAVAIGRAVQSRTSVPAQEADRTTPTGIMPAKNSAAAKPAAGKPPALPTKAPSLRAEAPPPPSRIATRTLLGIPSPISDRAATVPTTGPAPGKDVALRHSPTKIPERSVPPEGNPVVPRAAALPGAGAEAARPQRKLTTREIDGGWASTPAAEEAPAPVGEGRAPLPSFDLPLVDEGPRAAAVKPAAAEARARPPLPAAALKKPAPAVEAAPDRATGPTLPSRTAGGAPAPAAKETASSAGPEKAPEKVSATRTLPPPAPRLGSPRPPAKQPPPLPGRQVTATLVAAGASTPERAAAAVAPTQPAPVEVALPAATQPAAAPAATQHAPAATQHAPAAAQHAPAATQHAPAAAQHAPAAAQPAHAPVHAAPTPAVDNGPRVELREPPRAAPPLASAEDPLHLPPHRPTSPSNGAAGSNGAAAQPTGRSRSPLPPAPSTHDGTSFPLPPAAPRLGHAVELDPEVPVQLAEASAHASERPPALRSERPPALPSGAGLPVAVPLSSLFAAGGALIAMVVGAFFVGRQSAQPVRLVARPIFHMVPLVARAALPPPLKPCWVAKQPAMWAPRVSKSIPFDMMATAAGTLAIGYAREESDAVGLEVTPASGDVKVRFTLKAGEPIERVIPTGKEFKISPAAGIGGFSSLLHVPAASPFVVGVKGGALSVADRPEGQAAALWPLAGSDAPAAMRVQAMGEKGYGLTFRRDGFVWGGFVDGARKPVGALVKVPGSGGSVGKPSSGWNRSELAVIFADKPEGGDRWEIRVGRAPTGAVPSATQVVPLPGGGPGGDAFAPDIAGLPDGRWLMIWTEGAAGSRAVRAQTFGPDLSPLGDPIALSPPAGNFGQGGIGIVGGYAAAVFLSKGSLGFELWGSILQCG